MSLGKGMSVGLIWHIGSGRRGLSGIVQLGATMVVAAEAVFVHLWNVRVCVLAILLITGLAVIVSRMVSVPAVKVFLFEIVMMCISVDIAGHD